MNYKQLEVNYFLKKELFFEMGRQVVSATTAIYTDTHTDIQTLEMI